MKMLLCKEFTSGDDMLITASAIQGVTPMCAPDEGSVIYTAGFVWRVKDKFSDITMLLERV